MKKHALLRTVLFIFLVSFMIPVHSNAQCKLTLVTAKHDCNPAVATFLRADLSGKSISSFSWDFGDGSTGNDTTSVVDHQYTKVGCYTPSVTITYTGGGSCKASIPGKLCIYSPPKAVINLPDSSPFSAKQCFRHDGGLNKFCFTESSVPGTSGAPVIKYFWNFGDGSGDSLQSPCHSYQSPGTYTISLRVRDSNGCTDIAFKASAIIVFKDIIPSFTINGKLSCNSATYAFKNNSDTGGMNIKKFYWDFGDGSPLDSVNYSSVTHTYGPGNYHPRLTLVNKLGCSGFDVTSFTVSKFELKTIFKDTICWSDAKSKGISFGATSQNNVLFWQWNFGDPASGNDNIANYNWSATHKFAGGPGNYKVRFLMINSNPNCGKNGVLDTCFIVHIKGPMAMIQLPDLPAFPPNNYYPARPMPKSVFSDIANSTGSCGPQSVTYSTFTAGSSTRHVTYGYCYAKTLSQTVDSAGDCYGKHKIPYISGITLKPSDSVVSFYKDSTESIHTWTKGNTIPSGAYYPSRGTLNWNNMHDSNLTTCNSRSLVRFTNNSIKYRLRNQLDDNTYLNVTDPVHSWKDTCRWTNYPMASDSLNYFWKFNDPSGKACTSSVSNKDWDCNFSTLAAPYHYYRGKNGRPSGGSQVVNLKVTDPVTGCADSTVMYLKQGPPQAYWDKNAYCKMTWDMQMSGLAPKGIPGNSAAPLIGFQLNNQFAACTGSKYPFHIDFTQTIPVVGATHWWIVFDSASAVKYKKCGSGSDSAIDNGFLGSAKKDGYPIGGESIVWEGLPWMGNYWYEAGDSGCKTVGIVLQNGVCFDTAWYHDYICFSRLSADFNIFNVIPPAGKNRNEIFTDHSTTGHGHICQQGFNEGVNVRLYPADTTQKNITEFKYHIERRPFGPDAYYSLPFWPDSATLNPFMKWDDSVKQIDHKVYYADSAHLFVYVNVGSNTVKSHLYHFPLTKSEIDSLVARNHVSIAISDPRTRSIPTPCGRSRVTIYTDKVALSSSSQILNLAGPNAVDSLILPYPGFYTIHSEASNLQGCLEQTTYHLIYGHYATLNANNDSIICLGEKVNFNYYVRYWSTQCPVPAGGGPVPEGCLNGADEGMPMGVDFSPWNKTNPTAYRDSLVTGWSSLQKPAGYQPETIWWNFGDNPFFNKVPTGSAISHVYTKPGVYTVSMRTTDWRGCAVTTVRRNFIKVLQPVADFALENMMDTAMYCAPKSVRFLNKSTVLGASYTDKVVKNGMIVDSTFVADSIVTSVWDLGYRMLVNTGHGKMITSINVNGTYSVDLSVHTYFGCGAEKSIKNYITITGPKPKFELFGPTSGCAPFIARIRNHNSANVSNNVWQFGDSSSQVLGTSPPGDSLVVLHYLAPRGKFRIYVTQTDTFRDANGNKLPPCKADWPLPGDSIQHWITINPNSPVKIHGSRTLFKNKPGTFYSRSGYGEYKTFSWQFGNGTQLSNVKDSVESVTYTLSQCNAAPKDANGRAIFEIKVVAVSDSGCTASDTFHVYVDFTTGINERDPVITDLNIYPNPFNSGTTLEYSILEKSRVRIELLDITGRTISILNDELEIPGTYTREINAADYGLKPGVYMVRIIDAGGQVSKTLLKL
jgi:PKD repeat protein